MFASLSFPSRASPPLTPPQTTTPDGSRTSPASSDDSSCLELSFVYEVNAQGEVVRVSKGSSKSSAPPTPDQSPKFEQLSPPKPPSPVSHPRPSSLTRSESLPAAAFEPTPATTARSFQRVASGPIHTPASTSSVRSSVAPLSTGGTARKIGGARRVKLEEFQEQDALLRSQTQTADEKENVRGAPHSHVPSVRPIIPIRSARLLNKKSGIEKIVEDQVAEEHGAAADARPHSGITGRPRRSASLSDASGSGSVHDSGYETGLPSAHHYQQQYQRPGTSLGMTSRGARRVTIEEKIRQEREIALEEGYARREAEEAASEAERRAQASSRHSPSPTHVSSSHVRPSYGHQRKDSDTLRSIAGLSPSSPTAVELPTRASPPNRYLPSSTPGLSSAATNLRHRRSPTAPDPPTTSGGIAPPNGSGQATGKTWAAGDGREKERDDPYDAAMQARSLPAMQAPPPPAVVPVKQVQAPPPQQAAQASSAAPEIRTRNMVVNKKVYARLDMIGKGGSSRVYRVMNGSNEIYAIKRVSLDKTDAETMSGYMNEIALLKRLEGNSRIIRLIDSELKPGPGGSKGHLMLVMECGEIDLARLLQEQQKEPLDLVWISYYWKQMLQAVHIIHEEKIVHSDLKPANFVLVRGQLKLIDFGIANAIANDTTNIQRDHQIGTVNYMSPEAIELPDGMRRLKVGRPSDVWSLGCILYQMVYGQPPFQHLSVYQKMKAIPDGTHIIDFPEYSTPSIPASRTSGESSPRKLDHLRVRVPDSVISTMQSCLARNPKERMTIPALIEQDWLAMQTPPPEACKPAPPALKEDETIINPFFMQQLLEYGIGLGQQGRAMDRDELLREAERLVAELKGVQAISQ